ncbi:G-protein coupled receptor dmsr-1-like [Haliotis rubra]|uniref:G-protein coupled receptor dmsr-1-like n=1 Tax=Haliotis rubra TaxID=36100 RepID=UPI001EE4FB4E|nr:G-protein coupled receptor dmsr-1-like [Haliotis rubra]
MSSNISDASKEPFGVVNANLEKFAHWYWHIHGYLSLIICTFGIFTNILNVTVLTRKSMRTAINCILCAIAISDIVTMSSYIPYAVHFYLICDLTPSPERYSYGWTTFLAIHGNVTTTSHCISIWLAVFMAVMRYVYLQTKRCPSIKVTCALICVIPAFVALIMMPNYLITGVYEASVPGLNASIYRLNDYALGNNNPTTRALVAFWLYAIVGKLLPCTLISIFMGLLLKKLHESAKRQKRLFNASDHAQKKKKRHKCTTTMLLVIIVMYMITELPQSFIILMSASYQYFFRHVYFLLADVLDMAALINNAINFVLYCTMSQQFRDHLYDLSGALLCRKQRAKRKRFANNVHYDTVNASANQSHLDHLCVTTATSEKSLSHG